MAQVETTAWQYLCCPVAFLRRMGRIYFFNNQKETLKGGA